MPAVSARQQRFMGAEYARAKAGQTTQTGLGRTKLREMARKPSRGYGRSRSR